MYRRNWKNTTYVSPIFLLLGQVLNLSRLKATLHNFFEVGSSPTDNHCCTMSAYLSVSQLDCCCHHCSQVKQALGLMWSQTGKGCRKSICSWLQKCPVCHSPPWSEPHSCAKKCAGQSQLPCISVSGRGMQGWIGKGCGSSASFCYISQTRLPMPTVTSLVIYYYPIYCLGQTSP